MPGRATSHLAVLAAVLVLGFLGPHARLAHGQDGETRRVLVLNSYHRGYAHSDRMLEGIESVLLAEGMDLALYIEYMDTKRYASEEYFRKLYELYRFKSGDIHFDVVVCSDNHAFEFLLEYRDRLFPGTPVVFCGVDSFDKALLADTGLITGVTQRADSERTLEIALALRPHTRHVAVISDCSMTGRLFADEIRREVAPGFAPSVSFSFLGDSSMEDLLEDVRSLAGDAVVLLWGFLRDESGTVFELRGSTRRISEASPVPVFCNSEVHLGHGVLGGMLMSTFAHGEDAARIALRIMHGEKAEGIPVVKGGSNCPMFDHAQMKRWGIDTSDLPEGSIVVNKPYLFYEENRELVWGIVAFIVLQTLVIIVLCMNVSRRRRAEAALKVHSERLEDIVAERTQELVDAQKELVRRERLAILGELAAGVSHELRNPLGVINNAVYYLKSVLPDPDDTTTEYLDIISAEVHQSDQIISDLLGFSRIRSAKREETAVGDLVVRVLAQHPPPEQVEMITEIPPGIPLVSVAPLQIEQVVANLVINACQAMGGGGRLTIKVRADGERLSLTVADTGCGIPEKHLGQIFEPLFTIRARGIGMGLAVAKGLAEVNGGTLEVESEEGRGSVFTLVLPLKAATS